jgi:hypothetical protein
LIVAVSAIPFGRYQLGKPDALLPAVTSAAFVAMLVTAGMLRNQYLMTRYAPLTILAKAYSVTAFLSLPYLLSFPHVFSADGFGLGAQAAPWFWVMWHAFFVLLLGGCRCGGGDRAAVLRLRRRGSARSGVCRGEVARSTAGPRGRRAVYAGLPSLGRSVAARIGLHRDGDADCPDGAATHDELVACSGSRIVCDRDLSQR